MSCVISLSSGVGGVGIFLTDSFDLNPKDSLYICKDEN